jgi:hypothetical protein
MYRKSSMGGDVSPLDGTLEEGGFVIITIRLTIWVARVLGTVTAILGWLFLLATSSTTIWIAHMLGGIGTQLLGWLSLFVTNSSFILTHMVLGVAFALLLLAVSLIQLLTGRMRWLGASGIVYTLILTVLGFTQTDLLIGPMHWLIQTAHVLIGFGALVLVQVISIRDARLRKSTATVPVPRAMLPRAAQ